MVVTKQFWCPLSSDIHCMDKKYPLLCSTDEKKVIQVFGRQSLKHLIE